MKYLAVSFLVNIVCGSCSVFGITSMLKSDSKIITKDEFVNKKRLSGGRSQEEFDNLLPKLAPHKDTCYLMEFHHDDCDHAEQMEPVLQRLEDDLDTKIRRINISRRREFQSLLQAVGHDECGTFPFYYNRRTGQAICGATSYMNLKSWGSGEVGHLFHDPPENIHDRESRGPRKRDVGLKGFFTEKIAGLEKRGKNNKSTKSGTKSSPISTTKKTEKSNSSSESGSSSSSNTGKKTAAERTQERKAAREAKKKELATA